MNTTDDDRAWGDRDPRWRGITSRVLDVDGQRVAALWHDGATPGGTPHLLVHGLGGSATNWLEVMVGLAEDGPVVAVDLSGFGRTETREREDARLAPQRRLLSAVLDALGWDEVVVHGNSMGGLLSVLLAASEPDRVSALVLCAPALPAPRSLRGVSGSAALRLGPFVSVALGGAVLTRMWGRLDADAVYRETEKTVLADVDAFRPALREVGVRNVVFGQDNADWRVPGFAVAASDLIRHLLRRTEIDAAVMAVRAPTLVVWGTEDRLVSRAVVDRTLRRRPEWSSAILGGVGHVPQLEVPDAYLSAVRGWASTSTDLATVEAAG